MSDRFWRVKVIPRLLKWLLFDLVFALLPIGLHALFGWVKTEEFSFGELIADGELALIAAVLMGSCLGELLLVKGELKSWKVLCGFACLGAIVGSSLYFALVKVGMAAADLAWLNYCMFAGVAIVGATITTMAEVLGE